ncbi:MAG: cyclic nucleotide-binding domain-containing protein [Rubrivivax sp.]|nr:cyclic nucleotide-binding domain-containing protein [Rubrivivax sp.]
MTVETGHMGLLGRSSLITAGAAGAVGALVTVAIVLTLGVIAFAPLSQLGAAGAQAGIVAAFLCVVLSAAVYALLGNSVMPAGGPSSATALLAAALLARVVATAGDVAPAELLLQAWVCLAAAVTSMGALQLLMAALRLGRLASVVPQPVLSGFMNGIALLILLSQLPALLALPPERWQADGWRAVNALQPAALALGLGTAALVWLLQWRAPRLPASLLGLLAGVAAYHLLPRLWPALQMGPTLGAIDITAAWPGLLAGLAQPEAAASALGRHAGAIALTAVLLASIGTLESMLNLRAVDQQHGTRHQQGRELRALGLSNLLGGPLGALPMAHVRARAISILQAGGRGRAGAAGAVLASALLVTWGAPAIAALPQTVLAGVMVTIAVSLADRWSAPLWQRLRHGPGRRTVGRSLAIVVLVCALTVWQGPALGVAAGMLLATIDFVHGMNRLLIRNRSDGTVQPSRRVYRPALEALLQTARGRITVLALEGALFFGSAERVADEADTLPADCRFLVLDLRRVSTVDDSAVAVLGQLQQQLARRGVGLLLAGVVPGSAHQQQLQTFLHTTGAGAAPVCFSDTDHAVEHAERQLLATAAGDTDLGSSLPLAQSALMHTLTPAQVSTVSGCLQRRQLRAGERLFNEGDAADGLYVLTQGSVSITSASGQRFVSFSPATMLGELAMLDGNGRSASAVADTDSVVHLLSCEALAQLAQDDATLCALLYRNIAVHLAQRLRVATHAWRGAAG